MIKKIILDKLILKLILSFIIRSKYKFIYNCHILKNPWNQLKDSIAFYYVLFFSSEKWEEKWRNFYLHKPISYLNQGININSLYRTLLVSFHDKLLRLGTKLNLIIMTETNLCHVILAKNICKKTSPSKC